MKRKNWKNPNDQGAIILESLIVYPVTIFLLFFVLAIFSVLYQRWNLQTIANDAATRMAQTYRLNDAEEMSGKVTKDQLTGVRLYRYVGNLFSNRMEEEINDRVVNYATWRLQQTTFTKNVTEPQIQALVHPDALGRRHLEVIVSGEYAVPFGEMLSYFGFESTITYEAKAYADCVDMIDYMNFVDYVDEQTNISGTYIGLIDSVLSLLDNIFEK